MKTYKYCLHYMIEGGNSCANRLYRGREMGKVGGRGSDGERTVIDKEGVRDGEERWTKTWMKKGRDERRKE